jgi:Tfp pilus assembly pilus retraction ATPase PilT
MILVTGGTGLGRSTFIAVFDRISLGVEKIRAIYQNSSTIEKTKSLFELL